LVDGDFELVPTCSYHSHGVGESAIRMFDSFLVQTPEASPGHVDKESHVVLCSQVELDGPQEVVGFENEYHLSVDEGQNVSNLFDVFCNVLLDLFALSFVLLRPVNALGD